MGGCKRDDYRRMAAGMSDKELTGIRNQHTELPQHSDPEYLGGLGSYLWSMHMTYKNIVRLECRRRGL